MDFPTDREPFLFPRERLDDLHQITMELCIKGELYTEYLPYIEKGQYVEFRRIIHSALRKLRRKSSGELLDKTEFIEFGVISYSIWRYFDGKSLEGASPYVGTTPNMWVHYCHKIYHLLETQGPDAVWPKEGGTKVSIEFPQSKTPFVLGTSEYEFVNRHVLEMTNEARLYKVLKPYVEQQDFKGFLVQVYEIIKRGRTFSPSDVVRLKYCLVAYSLWEHWSKGTRPLSWNLESEYWISRLEIFYTHNYQKHLNHNEFTNPTKEETIMTTTTQSPFLSINGASPMFETRHYIFGVETKNMTKVDLIGAIQKIEAEISALKAVKTKTTYLPARIKECETMLVEVVKVLDADN